MAESKESKTYEFKAGMTCGGCQSAITRILSNMPGVTLVSADIEKKKVIVTSTVGSQPVLEKLQKWGKNAGKEVAFTGEVIPS